MRLIASAPNLEAIIGLIERFYCGTKITLVEAEGLYRVENSSGPIEGVRVVLRRGRYRFEGTL